GGSVRSSGQMVVSDWSLSSCMTGLIAGSITYNPEPLERPAPGNVLVCCSQPNAGVTLDLLRETVGGPLPSRRPPVCPQRPVQFLSQWGVSRNSERLNLDERSVLGE